MAGKKINAFNELCKDIMIANMADTLKAYGGFPELEKQVYDLKACTVMEVASAVPIVQNVVISAVVKTAVEQAKAQGGCADHIEKNFFVIHILNSLSC